MKKRKKGKMIKAITCKYEREINVITNEIEKPSLIDLINEIGYKNILEIIPTCVDREVQYTIIYKERKRNG